jgi:hypothetical protein
MRNACHARRHVHGSTGRDGWVTGNEERRFSTVFSPTFTGARAESPRWSPWLRIQTDWGFFGSDYAKCGFRAEHG